MNRKIDLLVKAIKDPIKAVCRVLALVNNKLKLTEAIKVSGKGERLVIKSWESAKNSTDFTTLAHIQRYEWISLYVKNLQCLDVGCGSGYGTFYLARKGVNRIVGVDISAYAVEFAKKHYRNENLEFMQMDGLDLKFRDNSFDTVICFDVLEHIDQEHQSKLISEIARVLRKTGVAYIGCPNAALSLGGCPFHKKELKTEEFELLLRRFFKCVKMFGQDLIVNGVRQKKNWHKCLSNLSYSNFVILEEDCDLTYGLLAICKYPEGSS